MSENRAESEYAVWTIPGTSFEVSYLLSLFHEIDFQVNEGYRRIPHGGVEIGGLLFGRVEASSARIEAFRPIACEHSRGPSFVLSEKDLAALREQLASAASDPELHDCDLLGWFIAHTRSALEVNERESALFDELFPEPGKLMLLIKPERFQPTRFVFLVRSADGKLAGSGDENAIILPLPGRGERAGSQPAASIPAPAGAPVATLAPAAPAPSVDVVTSERLEPLAEPPLEAPVEAPPEAKVPMATAKTPAAAPEFPSIEDIRRRRSEAIQHADSSQVTRGQPQAAETVPADRRSNVRLAIVLFIAAALGCVVGYFIYLQLPPAVIPLNVEKNAAGLIVSWPPEQTRDAVYAALRVDDGDPVALSPEQKAVGQAAIHATGGNVKIELTAQHWMRDSRGILRYVEPLPEAGRTAPSQ
ncbi:MAG: hypothetical protein JO340_11250 [Acidobacteriaceae bacterium]|nr:hypothetical protein [Acidobacteriaceae bacterium]